jgi:hypothetical protein
MDGGGGGSEVMGSDIGRLVSMEAAAYGETLENLRVHFYFNQYGNLHTRESDTIYRTRISTFLLYRNRSKYIRGTWYDTERQRTKFTGQP